MCMCERQKWCHRVAYIYIHISIFNNMHFDLSKLNGVPTDIRCDCIHHSACMCAYARVRVRSKLRLERLLLILFVLRNRKYYLLKHKGIGVKRFCFIVNAE